MKNTFERRQAARERIEARYRTAREREEIAAGGYTFPMEFRDILVRVMATAEECTFGDYAPEDPDGDDILAALALVDEAREQLDGFELRLIRQARKRSITWTDLAHAFGLRTRQSAESRALRLERASTTSHQDRDVSGMRAAKAGERRLDQWAAETDQRLRTAAEALVDSSEAWTEADLRDRAMFTAYIQGLAGLLASGGEGPKLWSTMDGIAYHLLPFDRRAPKAAGPKAAAAKAAVHELEQLRLLASKARGYRW